MSVPSRVYAALARALAPPRGIPSAFAELGLCAPGAGELMAEHTGLFGRAGQAVLSPYGAHRGQCRLEEVLAAFRQVGFAPDPGFRDRPDHICIWLAILEGLARDAEIAEEAGDASSALAARETLARFVRRHTEPWLPGLFLEMALLNGYPLHRQLAHKANGFLLAGRAARHADVSPRSEEPELRESTCAACGKPMGLLEPATVVRLPPWSSTCVRCRLRTDLRRSAI